MSPRFFCWLGVFLTLGLAQAQAAMVPIGFVDKQIGGGLTSPTTLTALPDGRVLVVQQNGNILLVRDDVVDSTHFWDVPSVDSSGERGCLGITPDPNFADNHYVYVFCTIKDQSSNNHVIRVTERDGRALPGSDTVILTLPKVTSVWHMGGALHFAPDGTLYIAAGNQEDEPQTADEANSQNLSNGLGKILRIRADGSVPSDNPFVDQQGAFGPIWSYGYRNPFSFDIQPGTGLLLTGDVGQGAWEEIDTAKRGKNYGWPTAEGPSKDARFESPVYAFTHENGRCAVTGGAFYNPRTPQFPDAYVGMFLFEEFCNGTIQALDPSSYEAKPFVTGIGYPTNLAIAPDGSLYYLSRNQDTETHDPGVGSLNKITYTGTATPRISKNPQAQTIVLGDSVTFSVDVQGADQLQWQRDGVDIQGATDSSYTIASTSMSDDGAVFLVVATNMFGSVKSLGARLTVTSNRPPMAAIAAAVDGVEYAPNDTLTFDGSAQDPEDGALPESAFTWQVDFQHDTHAHPLVEAMSGKAQLSFKVPDFEAGEANTWVRVHLTARDSAGATHSVYKDVFPRTQLSSLTPLDPAMNGSGPVERDRSNGESGVDGSPIAISAMPYLRGLGVHAPSDLRFYLGGACNGQFISDVGVDDEVGDTGSVVFQVFLDDQMVFDSGVKRGSEGRSSIALSIAGKHQLRLVVTDAGDGKDGDHADWAAARITGCGMIGAPPPMMTMPDQSAADGGTNMPRADDAGVKTGGSGAPSSSDPALDGSAGESGKEAPKPPAMMGNEHDAAGSGSFDAGTPTAMSSQSEPAGAETPIPPPKKRKSGCSVAQAGGGEGGLAQWGVGIPLAALWVRRNRGHRRAC